MGDTPPGPSTDGPLEELSDDDMELLLYDTGMDAEAREDFIEALNYAIEGDENE